VSQDGLSLTRRFRMKHKRLIAIFLVMMMIVGMIPVSVFAKDEIEVQEIGSTSAGEDGEHTGEVPPQTVKGESPSDNDDLFKSYIENRLENEKVNNRRVKVRKRAAHSGDSLSTYNRNIYYAVKPKLAEVAAGERISTRITMTYSEIGLAGVKWYASDLGVSSIVNSSGQLTDAARNAVMAKLDINLKLINNSLLADCPFELYWFDKTAGVSMSGVPYSYTSSYISFKATSSITMGFCVAKGYAVYDSATGSYSENLIDTTKITRVNNAIATAKSVVATAKNKTDYEKLGYYRTWICDQVTYDHVAAGGGEDYGDPWQLISAFDNDSSTNIVCEGYSKAFMYLCDLTSFGSDITCITVTGVTSGGHMWNIVNMEDGKNYLVDVTNCDSGTVGYPDKLFLAGCTSGSVAAGYTFKTRSGSLTYKYDTETKSIYSSELVISTKNYVPTITSGTCGTDLKWKLSGGVLTITGTGSMTDYGSTGDYPWKGNIADIKAVVISDGVTSIGTYAFYNCTGITKVTIPDSLTRIGNSAFGNCTGITTVNYGSTKSDWGKIVIGTGNDYLTGAKFDFTYYSVTMDANAGGSVKLSADKAKGGDTITITAVPAAGYDLVSVELNGTVLLTNEFTMPDEDVTVKVTFAAHTLIKKDGKAATCTEDGYEEYYFCTRCNKLFSDREGTKEISEPVVIKALGHDWDDGTVTKAATCEDAGTKVFKCKHSGCQETRTETLDALGHDLKEIPEKVPTATEPGNYKYYECLRCGKLYSDAQGKNEIKLADTVIPMLTHTLTPVEAKAATCTADGVKAHFKCTDDGCGKLFSDKYGVHEIKPEDIVDPKKGHDLEPVAKKDATCTEAGHEAYFKCKRCGHLFSDEHGNNEISEPVVISALGHDKEHLEHHEYKAPSRDNDGNYEYYVCPGCGKYFKDADCKEEVKPVETIIPAIGAAKLGEQADIGAIRYEVTNPSTDGTGTVKLIGMANPSEVVSIPSTVVYKETTYKVNRIGTKAFYGDKTLKSVTIGANVVIIDANAFYGCSNLKKVAGGAGLKTIGTNAFARCSKLSSFVIKSKILYKIGVNCFYKDSKLKTLYLKYTTKLTKSGVKKSLKGSKVKTVKVKKSKIRKYRKYFRKSNSGRYVKVKK